MYKATVFFAECFFSVIRVNLKYGLLIQLLNISISKNIFITNFYSQDTFNKLCSYMIFVCRNI